MKRMLLATVLAALPGLGSADDISDTLKSALEAYEAGDIKYALEELAFAQQLLQAIKTEGLVAFLPAAPEGWTRTVNTEMNAGLAMMGGGTGAEADYSNGSQSFRLTITADNPMVAGMAGIFANPMLMSNAGKIVRVGREKFLNQNGELMGVINGRIMIQAGGADETVLVPVLEQIDFQGLAGFGL